MVWFVYDAAGNADSCSFTVTVIDDEDPCIGCDDPNDPTYEGISCNDITMGTGNVTVNTYPAGANTYTHSGTGWDINATDNVGVVRYAYELRAGTSYTAIGNGENSLDGVTFPLDVTTVVWFVYDAAGNADSCSFTVTVIDDEDPCIGCDDPNDPTYEGISCADITMNTGSVTVTTNQGVNTYTHGDSSWDITATDNVGVVRYEYELRRGATNVVIARGSDSLEGAIFPLGETTVVWFVYDAAGNADSCSFMVTVIDTEDPIIGGGDTPSCDDVTLNTGNVTVNTDTGANTYTHSGTDWDIDATDNVGVVRREYELREGNTYTVIGGGSNTLNGVTFPLGVTTVVWFVYDDANNADSCSFTVTVVDDEDPCIGCDDPNDPTYEGISCDDITMGTGNVTVSTEPGANNYVHRTTDWDINATDNVGVVSIEYELRRGNTVLSRGVNSLVGANFQLGETTVVWFVYDAAGNADSCSFVVTVVDNEDPCIGCDDPNTPAVDGIDCDDITLNTGNVTVDTDPGTNTYTHHGSGWNITATDNVGVISTVYELRRGTTYTVIGNGENTLDGVTFPLGVTTVVWFVYDAANNADSCSFTVTVVDNEDPVIGTDPDPNDPTVNGISCESIVEAMGGTAGVSGNGGTFNVETTINESYYEHDNAIDGNWDITASDNVGVDSIMCRLYLNGEFVAPTDSTTLDGQHFAIGTTQVVWRVVDVSGNESTCDFYVVVADHQPPCIGCDSTSIDPYTPIDPDNPGGHNGRSCESIVAAAGSQLPSTVEVGTTEPYDYYTHVTNNWDITASDNVGIPDGGIYCNLYDSHGNLIATHLPTLDGRNFEIGTTTVMWVVVDDAGNSDSCSFVVYVRDDDPPCIGCDPNDPDDPFDPTSTSGVSCASITSGDGTVNVPAGSGLTYYQHNDDSWDVSANDNSGIASIVYSVSGATTVVNGLPTTLNGQRFYVGTTLVTWVATDLYGLTDTCTFYVYVYDDEQPEISCPDGITGISCIGDVPPAYQSYEEFAAAGGSAADANGIDESSFMLVSQESDGNTCPEVITRTYRIADVAGNMRECTQTITVNDEISPVISGPAPTLNVGQGQGCSYAVPDFTELVRSMSSDNCTSVADLVITQSPLAGTATMITENTTVRITVTDACGRSSYIDGTAIVPSPLSHTVSFTEIMCAGQSSTVTIEAVGGTAPYHGVGQIVEYAGQHNYIVSDANGCTSNVEIVITEPLPLRAIIPATSVQHVDCYGETTGEASVSVDGGTPEYTYEWSDLNHSTTQSISNLAAGRYVVTVTDAHGCISTSAVVINGQSIPLTAAVGNSNITNVSCFGTSTGSATAVVSGGTPEYNYSWNTTPVQNVQTAVNVPAGTYVVVVTDAHGCTTSASATIAQPPLLEVSSNASDATCGGLGGNVTANVSGGTGTPSYSWVTSSGLTYSSARLSNVAPSTYYLTVTDYNGCTATSMATVGVHGSISARIEVVSLPGCGTNVTSGRLQAVAVSGISPFTYIWNNGTTDAIASNLQAGSYNVTLTDYWGCTANASASIEQLNDLEITVSGTNVSCYGYNDATAMVVALRGEPPYTYEWNNGDQSAMLQNIFAGNYTVTVTDANMCTRTESLELTQPEQLMLVSNVKSISCYGKTDGSIALTAEGGISPYTFNVTMNENTFNGNYMTNLPAGTYVMEVTDASGCMSSNTIQIIEPEEFVSTYNVTMPSCNGNNDGMIEISARGGTAPYMYGWDSYYSDVPVLTGLRQGQYTISVVDANKCAYQVASLMLTDMAGDCIKIPNVFTPNGDGVNDTWIIENIEMFPQATGYVFNRWGQMLYKGTGNDEPWDGSYRGHHVPAGTYLYIVDLYQKTEAYKGTVTVIY